MFVIIFRSLYPLSGLLSISPPGRDQDYQNLILTYAVDVLKVALIITWFPRPLKSYVVLPSMFPVIDSSPSIVFKIVSNLSSKIQQQIEFIRPMVEERFAKMDEYGKDWDDKPVCQTIVSNTSLIPTPRPIHRTTCLCGS